MTLDELMEKMAGQRRTNVTQATKEAFDADKAYREYKQKQKEQKERQAANEKAMRNAEAEQRRKEQLESRQKQYRLAADLNRQQAGLSAIAEIPSAVAGSKPQSPDFQQESNSSPTIPKNWKETATSTKAIINAVENTTAAEAGSEAAYQTLVAQRKAQGKTDREILQELGDYTQYRERTLNPSFPTIRNFESRYRATNTSESSYAGSAINNFYSAFTDSFLTDLFTGPADAINKLVRGDDIERAQQYGLDVSLPSTQPSQTMEEFKPLSYEEMVQASNTNPYYRALLQNDGWIASDGTPTEKMNNLKDTEGWGVAGNVAGEILEAFVVGNAMGAGGLSEKISNSATRGLSKLANGKLNQKVISYIGKSIGESAENVVLELPSSVGRAYADSESNDEFVKELSQNLAFNLLAGIASPALEIGGSRLMSELADRRTVNSAARTMMEEAQQSGTAITRQEARTSARNALKRDTPRVSVLQDSYNRAMRQSPSAYGSLAEAITGRTASEAANAADEATDTANMVSRITEAADSVSTIPEDFKAAYRESVARQVEELNGIAEFSDSTLDYIDYNARVEAGYRNILDTINNRIRNQYGDDVADQILTEMNDALKSEQAFSDYLVRVYSEGGVFSNRSAKEYANSITQKIKDKESYQKWLDSIEDSRWVSSDDISSSDGYMDYVSAKAGAAVKDNPSMSSVVDASQSEPQVKHRFINNVIYAADEAVETPKGVGAAEAGFTRSMDKEAVDNLLDADEPIDKIAESIGEESAIVNASRSVSDAPLDANVTIGEGAQAKTITGREYIDRLKNSPFTPKTPEEMNRHIESINRDIARATLVHDNESLTFSLLQLQAAKEAALLMDYDAYLQSNGELSRFIQNILGTDEVQNTPELLYAVSGLESRYIPRHRASQIADAQKILSHDSGANSLYGRLYDKSVAMTDTDVVAAKLLSDQLRAEGKYDEAAQLYELIQQKARDSGRAVESLKMFQDTPEMMVYKARKLVEEAAGKDATSALDDLAAEAHKADNAAVKKKVNQVASDFDSDLDALNQAQDDAIKGVANDIDNAVNRSQNSAQALLKRIESASKKTGGKGTMTKDDILTARMVNDLYAVAKNSSIPEVASRASQMDRWELARAALEDRHTYRSVWNETRTMALQKYANDPDMLSTLETWTRQWLDDTDMLDQTIGGLLTQALREQGFKMSDFIDPNLGGDKVRVFAQGVVNKLGLVGADGENVTDYIIRKIQSRLDEPMRALRNAVESGATDEQALKQVVTNALISRGTTMRKIVEEYYAGDQAADLVEYIVRKSGLSGDNADRLREMLKENIYSNMESIRAQEMNKLFQKSRSETIVKKRGGTINLLRNRTTRAEKAVNLILSGGKTSDYRDAIAKVYNVPHITKDQIMRIADKAQKMQGLPRNTEAYNRMHNDILDIAAENTGMRGVGAYAALQKTGMLSNIKTHIVNMSGNAAGLGAQRINNAYASLLERILGVSPDQRMHRLNWSAGEAGKAREAAINKAWNDAAKFEYSKSGRWSDPRKTAQGRYSKVFKGSNAVTRVLNKYTGTISDLLNAEDMIFAKQAFRQSAGSMMAAQGIETMTDEISERALNEAMFYTFHNSNALSNLINQAKRIPGAGKVLDLTILPFVGTPVEIMKQAVVDYNPVVAAIRSIKNMRGGNVYDAINIAAKGLTGLSAYVMGSILHSMGVIKLGSSAGKERSLATASREDDFSLQFGPYSIHVGNLQPYMIPVMQGAALSQAVDDAVNESEEGIKWEVIMQGILSDWAGVAMDNSMWSSIENITSSRGGETQIGDVAGRVVENYMGSIVPAAVGAVANASDNTRRMSNGDTFLENGMNRLLSRMPGYSYTQEAMIDMWGNEVVDTGVNGAAGTALDTFNSIINPLRVSVDPYAKDPLTNEVERLFSAGYNQAVPSTPDDTFDFDGKTYTMTNAEYADMCREIGKLRYTRANNLIGTSTFQARDDEKKADALAKIYSAASTEVRNRWKAKLAKNLDKE